jgi:hypothetical protein
MANETDVKAPVDVLMDQLKPGSVYTVETFTVKDANMCHGFGTHSASPYVERSHHLGVAEAPTGDSPLLRGSGRHSMIDFLNGTAGPGIKISGRSVVLDDDRYVHGKEIAVEDGFFIPTSSIPKLNVVTFKNAADLELQRTRVIGDPKNMIGHGGCFGGHEEGQEGDILSVNIFVGSRDVLCNDVAERFDDFKVYDTFRKLKLQIPLKLLQRVAQATEQEILELFKAVQQNTKNWKQIREMLDGIRKNEAVSRVRVVHPVPGVSASIKVEPFLNGVERMLKKAEKQSKPQAKRKSKVVA